MQLSKTNKYVKLPGILFLSLLTITLFSCSKNTEEITAATGPKINAGTVSSSSASRATSTIIPMDRTYFVSCANGGNGEDVQITGNLNIVGNLVTNDNRYTFTYHINPQGLTGVGLITGDRFVASGGSQGTQSGILGNGQFTYTYTEQLRIVGASATFLVNYKFHVTITPDGTYTVSISDEEVDCRAH